MQLTTWALTLIFSLSIRGAQAGK